MKALFFVISFLIINTMSGQIPRSYGDIQFQLPSIYAMTTYDDAAVLNYTDENNNNYPMFIYPTVASTGDPNKDFIAGWTRMYGGFSRTESGNIPLPVKKSHLKGWEYYEAGANCVHNNGKVFYGWLSIHIVNNKMVAFGSGAPSQTQFDYNKISTNIVLNSLGFSFFQSPNLLAQKSGFTKGISGVWQGLRSALSRDGIVGRAIKRIVFYDDGVFCYEMPSTGLDSLDRVGANAFKNGFWGTYGFNGNTGAVNFSIYKNEPLTLAGSNLKFFTIEFEKLRSIDGLRLEGIYTSQINPKDWWRGYEPLVKFNKDGTFEDKSALFDIDEEAGRTCPTQNPGKGKYFCRNFSLALLYDDGRKAQIALFTIDWKNPSSPEYISLGKGLLKKKK